MATARRAHIRQKWLNGALYPSLAIRRVFDKTPLQKGVNLWTSAPHVPFSAANILPNSKKRNAGVFHMRYG